MDGTDNTDQICAEIVKGASCAIHVILQRGTVEDESHRTKSLFQPDRGRDTRLNMQPKDSSHTLQVSNRHDQTHVNSL